MLFLSLLLIALNILRCLLWTTHTHALTIAILYTSPYISTWISAFFDAAIRQTIRSAMNSHGIYRHVEEENQKKNVVKRKNVARMIGKYREKKKQWLNSKMWKSAHLTVSCCFFFFRHDRCADISTAKK